MDYKEKYEMALEGIQEILGSGEDSIKMSRLQLRLQGIFPELAEPDDEKIRKQLLEMVHDFTSDTLWVDYNIHKEDAIAWLEKQGEQKSIVEMKSPEESLGIDSETYNKIVDECIYGDAEQKPAETEKGAKENEREIPFSGQEWSEEDEKMYLKAIKYIQQSYYSEKVVVDWLKSLKDRVQPKQEWSDEDNEHIKSIISTIECSKAQFPNSQAVLEAYNSDLIWLKSIRHQNQWKPSDEQMEALRKAEATIGVNHVVLAGLISDLEKLKG